MDLGERFVAVVRGRGRGRSLRVEILAQGTPSDPAVATALAGAASAMAQDRAGVAVALAGRDGLTRRLVAPMASVSRARRVLPSLLDTRIPMPLEACVVAMADVHTIKGGQVGALGIAAPRTAVDARIAECRMRGVDPAALDFEPVALWAEALVTRPPAAGTARVVAYAGPDRMVWAAGRGAAFETSVAAAGTGDGEPAVDVVDDWIAKARHFLMAWGQDGALTSVEWIWVGPSARGTAWRNRFEQALAGSGTVRFDVVEQTEVFLARALARRGPGGDALAVNLRTGPSAAPAVVRRLASQERLWWLAAAAAGLILLGLSAAGWIEARQCDQVVRRALVDAVRKVAGDVVIQPGQELRAAKRAIEAREAEMAAAAALFRPGPAELLKLLLEDAARTDLRVSSADLADKAFTIAGTAPDWDGADRAASAIRAAGWTVEIKREDAGADERVPFTMKGTRP